MSRAKYLVIIGVFMKEVDYVASVQRVLLSFAGMPLPVAQGYCPDVSVS